MRLAKNARWIWGALIFVFGGACASTPLPPKRTPASSAVQVLALSDIHFDPLYDPTLVDRLVQAPAEQWKPIFESSKTTAVSGYGSDSNYPLLESALRAMRASTPHPALVIIGGDFLVHDFERGFQKSVKSATHPLFEAFASKAIQFLALEIERSFPDSQILPALGNNDSACGDYMSQPHSRFLADFSQAWGAAIHSRAADREFAEGLGAGGYYSVPAEAVPGLRVIVLNGTFWSHKYKNACGSPSDDPGAAEMAWLDRELAESAQRREHVWIVNHIPAPGSISSRRRRRRSTCAKEGSQCCSFRITGTRSISRSSRSTPRRSSW